MGGLAATMLLIFAHSWMAIYLVGVARLFRDAGYDLGASRLRLGKHAAGLALLLTTGNFVIAVMTLAGDFPGWIHIGSVGLILLANIAALLIEWEAVREAVRGLSGLKDGASSGARA